jgi:hypothetical protein
MRDLIFMVRDVKASEIYGSMTDQHDVGSSINSPSNTTLVFISLL